MNRCFEVAGRLAIVAGVAVTLALGVMPSPLLDLAQSTAAFLR